MEPELTPNELCVYYLSLPYPQLRTFLSHLYGLQAGLANWFHLPGRVFLELWMEKV